MQPVDAVAELREQRGENGQRADHRERDDDHRRVPEGGEGGVAGQEQAGHRHHHRQAGDEHRAAGGGSGGLERGALAPPGGPFLSFAPEVEHRVVDTDREPDQQHDGERFGCKREQVARQRRQPEGREHRRERQQQRDARGHECAEGDDEDDQRERDREHARALEVVREGGVDRFGRARTAELSDEEARMGALGVGDALEDRAELVHRLGAVAADLELDERGMPALCDLACVGRVERRADVLHGRHRREAGHDVLDGCVEGGRACSKRAALDQHALTRGHLEPGIEDPVHAARLAGARLGRIGLLRADLAADSEGDAARAQASRRWRSSSERRSSGRRGPRGWGGAALGGTASRLTSVFRAPRRSSWQLLCRGISRP